MAIFDDAIDDLPVFSRGKASVREERVPTPKSFKGSVLKVANRIGRSNGQGRGGAPRGGHINRGAKPVSVKSAPPSSRRVIIKARYVQQGANGAGAKASRLHLKYVERDGVNEDGGKGQLYSAEGRDVDGDSFLARSDKDPHQFRFIVSAEDSGELDLKTFTQDLMAQAEADLGRELDWVAVNHHDTENPHSHILVRGRDADGKALRIDSAYLSHGFRDRAREIVTRELGPRLAHEIEDGWRKEVGQERWTSLDYQIEKVSHEKLFASGERQVVALGEPGAVVHRNLDRYVVGRLNHLETMGLAEKLGPRDYALDPDYRTSLGDLGVRNDIIKTMHRAHNGEPGQYRIYDAQRDPIQIQGQLRQKGIQDELNDRHYAIVDTAEGRSYFVKLPKSSDFEALRVGEIVEVTSTPDPWLKKSDGVIADHAAQHGGVYRQDEHANALAADGQFAKRKIDPLDYAQAHARRVQRLVRFGMVTKTADGFQVPADLEDRLSAKDRDDPNPKTVSVGVTDARSVKTQIGSRGPAWIDRVDLEVAGTTGFGSELREARRLRALFLQKDLGLDPEANNLGQQLSRIERTDLAAAHAAQSGKEEKPLTPGMRSKGRLVGKLEGVSGKQFGVMETEREFSLVPWRQPMERGMGRQMSFGMDRAGMPFAQALGKGIGKS